MEFMTKIVLHFLRSVSRYAPLLLVVVKHQFMSKDDWFLTHAVCKKIHSGELRNVSFLVAGWPQRNKAYSNRYCHCDAALGYEAFRNEFCADTKSENADHRDTIEIMTTPLAYNGVEGDFDIEASISKAITIEIGRWSKSDVEEFLKIEFDIKRCSPQLVKFVHNKTGGIPAMCKALVRDHHLVFVKNGGHLDCSTIERLGDLALGFKDTDIHFPIPASIQSYFTKMMDALNDYDNSQFILITLKTATLICTGQEFQSLAFALDTLRACHPLFDYMDDEEFQEAIEVLTFEGFIREGSFEEERRQFGTRNGIKQIQDPFYVFCSGFARDVIYNVMLYKQRSELHRQVIEELARYEEMLESHNLRNDELRNALCRHEQLQLFDGMKSNFEIEEETQIMMGSPMKNALKRPQFNNELQNSQAMVYQSVNHGREDSTPHFQYAAAIPRQSATSGMPPSGRPDDDDYDDLEYEQLGGINIGDRPRPSVMTRVPPCVLVVFLKTAKNIPRLDDYQIPNVYVTFHYGHGKTAPVSQSRPSNNFDDDDDPIWNEYAGIPLSRELLRSDSIQRITIKFWNSTGFDDDVMIGKAHVDLVDLYEEQIKQHRHLENKLQTPRNSVAAMNFHQGLKKQLEDRDYIFVEKVLKMVIDDDHTKREPKQPSTFEAMFKFCVLQNISKFTVNEDEHPPQVTEMEMNQPPHIVMDSESAPQWAVNGIEKEEEAKSSFVAALTAEHSVHSDHSEDIRHHYPVMSHLHGGGGMTISRSRVMPSFGGVDSLLRPYTAHHEEQSTALSSTFPPPLKMQHDATVTSNRTHSAAASLHTNTPVNGIADVDFMRFDSARATGIGNGVAEDDDNFMPQFPDEQEIDFAEYPAMEFVQDL